MGTTANMNLYEGMFLVDSALAGGNWEGVIDTIKTILKKVNAEIISLKKWDDRKLAYDIKGVSRGTYILSYFKADGEKIKDIEKSVQLSEQIMRALILNAEGQTEEDMKKESPAAKQEKEKEKAEVESKLKEEAAAAEEAQKPASDEAEQPAESQQIKQKAQQEETELDEQQEEESVQSSEDDESDSDTEEDKAE